MNIKSIIEKEQKNGYHDSAIFGGLSAWLLVQAVKGNYSDLADWAEQYAAAPLSLRPALLEQLKAISAQIPELNQEEAKPASLASVFNQDQFIALNKPLSGLKQIGDKRAQALQKLGVSTIYQLLFFFPRSYRDWRQTMPLDQLIEEELVLIGGRIIDSNLAQTRTISIVKAQISDDSDLITAVWYNQPFVQRQLYAGREIVLLGKLSQKYGQREFAVQQYEFLDKGFKPQIMPIYRATAALSTKLIAKIISDCLQTYQLDDIMPQALRQKYNFPSRNQAIISLHQPREMADIEQARQCLAYEELLIMQLAMATSTVKEQQKGYALAYDQADIADFCQKLPFTLTKAQDKVLRQIYSDMSSDKPMSRLVQGDVGSGKTVIAAAAIYQCCRHQMQATMMAPTEILARQHYQSLSPLLAEFGLKTAFLAASTPAKEKREIAAAMANHELDVLIGTHALIQGNLQFAKLGLAITDEQHRFGVRQREALKAESPVHMLVMTATPIPRTLALTLYSDLQISIIDELPPGRKPIETYAVGYQYEPRIHTFIGKELAKGRQAFIVCPLVEDNENVDLKSVKSLALHLQEHIFSNYRVGLLHGKMKPKEKEEIMADFAANRIHILVATTVIEVGINIPNASIMLIRDAERFGLAQLHQLRGRIGRGAEQSYCILMHQAANQAAAERMKIIANCADGFALAEADLKIRGPGEFFGSKQHGLPELKIADILRDADLLNLAHQDAKAILANQYDDSAAIMQEVKAKLELLLKN